MNYLLGNALVRRAVMDLGEGSEKVDRLPTEEYLQNGIQRILSKLISSQSQADTQNLPYGLKTSCEFVLSVLCLKTTKSGELHRGRRATRIIEKLSPWIEQNKSTIIKEGLLVDETEGMESLLKIQQSSDAVVDHSCSTYSQCVWQFFLKHLPEMENSVVLGQDVFIDHPNSSGCSSNRPLEFESIMGSFLTQEWNTYRNIKRGDATAHRTFSQAFMSFVGMRSYSFMGASSRKNPNKIILGLLVSLRGHRWCPLRYT